MITNSTQSHLPTESDIVRIAAILKRESGIEMPKGKATLIQARLSKRLKKLRVNSYHEYCNLLEGQNGAQEIPQMVSALTTNVTRFFRESHHFDYILNVLCPIFEKKLKNFEPVRIWSAACSTGEEAYSIAATILSGIPTADSMDIKILATDIDHAVIGRARAGAYSKPEESPIHEIPFTEMYKKVDQHTYTIAERLKGLVTFNKLNLHSDWPMTGRFDLIVCRNAVIYFSKEDEERLWRRFIEHLHDEGTIMVGHSERIPTGAEYPVKLVATTTYQKTH